MFFSCSENNSKLKMHVCLLGTDSILQQTYEWSYSRVVDSLFHLFRRLRSWRLSWPSTRSASRWKRSWWRTLGSLRRTPTTTSSTGCWPSPGLEVCPALSLPDCDRVFLFLSGGEPWTNRLAPGSLRGTLWNLLRPGVRIRTAEKRQTSVLWTTYGFQKGDRVFKSIHKSVFQLSFYVL